MRTDDAAGPGSLGEGSRVKAEDSWFSAPDFISLGKSAITMASCEKCWKDAKGDPERYRELMDERTGTDQECTPEEQAGGEYAGLCPQCNRKTVHCVVERCVNPVCVESEFE